MTDELSPEFLKFSEMLDLEENPEFQEEEKADAELLQELSSALREDESLALSPDFAAQTAVLVMDRFQSLSPWQRAQLKLQRFLLQPVWRPSGVLTSLGFISSVAGLGYLGLKPLFLLGSGLLMLCLLWSFQHLLRDDVWGLGAHQFRMATFQRISLALPLLTAIIVFLNSGWQAGALAQGSIEGKTLGSATLLLLATPILMWLSRTLVALHAVSPRPRWVFASSQLLSLAILGGVAWQHRIYGIPRVSESHLLAFGGPILLGLILFTALYPVDCWRLEATQPRLVGRLTKAFFYTLPLLNALFTAAVLGGLLYYMGYLSVTFRDNLDTLLVLATFLGVSVGFLILNASYRYWEAVLAQAKAKPWQSVRFQFFQVVWGFCLAVVILSLVPKSLSDRDYHALLASILLSQLVVGGTAFVSAYLGERRFRSRLELKAARRRSFQSILFGLVPIALATVIFYQLNLTREIHHSSYAHVLEDVKNWKAHLASIPDEENGWLVLRPYLIRPEMDNPEHQRVNKELKVLSDYTDYVVGEDNPYLHLIQEGQLEEFQANKETFLKHLPLLKEAMAKPYFSHGAVEGNRIESWVPDFIGCRAISQSFDLLFLEALAQENPEEALRFATLGLRWGTKIESGSLIALMIRIAQLAISYQHLEEAVLSGAFDSEQLAHLSQELQKARPGLEDFSICMKRESVMCDGIFDLILEQGEDASEVMDSEWMVLAAKVLPKSYWRSERKAYWNYQLANSHRWSSLALPPGENDLELLPFNMASEMLVPNLKRARAQFCYLHSKYSSLILVCELERYKLDQGHYPEALQDLIPNYLKELPEDLMQPQKVGKKGTFQYRLIERGYLLTSKSSAYEKVQAKTEQVYGHDGDFNPYR